MCGRAWREPLHVGGSVCSAGRHAQKTTSPQAYLVCVRPFIVKFWPRERWRGHSLNLTSAVGGWWAGAHMPQMLCPHPWRLYAAREFITRALLARRLSPRFLHASLATHAGSNQWRVWTCNDVVGM